ncbi:hypothetical protein ACVS9P_08230 [Caproicibacterium sp. NSD3]
MKNVQTILSSGQDKIQDDSTSQPFSSSQYGFTRGADTTTGGIKDADRKHSTRLPSAGSVKLSALISRLSCYNFKWTPVGLRIGKKICVFLRWRPNGFF